MKCIYLGIYIYVLRCRNTWEKHLITILSIDYCLWETNETKVVVAHDYIKKTNEN